MAGYGWFVVVLHQNSPWCWPQDFDPLPRMAAIYGMAELCGVGHRKAARTRPPQLNHGFGTGKERRKMFSFPSFFMTGEIFFRFSDFPLGLKVNFEESSNVEVFFFESIFGMQHDATPSMTIQKFQILLICVFWDNPEPVFCVGQGISSIYPLVN